MSSEASFVRSATLLQAVRYINVASFAVLLYDCFETLDMEVELIWQAKWGKGKILFLLARYPTVIEMALYTYDACVPSATRKVCNIVFLLMFSLSVFGVATAQVILVLRTCALWGNDRRVLVFLSLMYFACTVAIIAISVVYFRSLTLATKPTSPASLGCFPIHSSKILFYTFVLLMVSETITMLLTLWIGFREHLLQSPTRLVVVLYKDGILYYIYLFLFALGNLITYVVGPPELAGLLALPQRVSHSIVSTRILLHVRSVASQNRSLPNDFILGIRSQADCWNLEEGSSRRRN